MMKLGTKVRLTYAPGTTGVIVGHGVAVNTTEDEMEAVYLVRHDEYVTFPSITKDAAAIIVAAWHPDYTQAVT